MYAIYWNPDISLELLVDGISEADLPELLRAMRCEFPGAFARRVL